jgi:hypothetical protein
VEEDPETDRQTDKENIWLRNKRSRISKEDGKTSHNTWCPLWRYKHFFPSKLQTSWRHNRYKAIYLKTCEDYWILGRDTVYPGRHLTPNYGQYLADGKARNLTRQRSLYVGSVRISDLATFIEFLNIYRDEWTFSNYMISASLLIYTIKWKEDIWYIFLFLLMLSFPVDVSQ